MYPGPRLVRTSVIVLFLLAAGATLTIWVRNPIPERVYEVGICLLGAAVLGTTALAERLDGPYLGLPAATLILIGIWGFGQLLTGCTAYRWATLDSGLRMLGLAATGLVAWYTLGRSRVRDLFMRALAWFAFLLSCVSILACFTSAGKVLWLFPAPYPDVWGPFLSRNNLAQFLELSLPVPLALGLRREAARGGLLYLSMAAAMLAAGWASASRAGAVLLVAESSGVFWLVRCQADRDSRRQELRKALIQFATVGAMFGALFGSGAAWVRIHQSDPLEYRGEIYRSAIAMIRANPLTGTGLGTFARVYPAHASFDNGATVEHAHNDWLEWAAEGGLGYTLIWAAFSILLVRPAIRSVWGLGVLAVFVHALVDDPFARFGVAAWVFILAGALARSGGDFRQSRTIELREAGGSPH